MQDLFFYLLRKTLILLVVLFLPAGRLGLPMFWAYIFIQSAYSLAGRTLTVRRHPALDRERSCPGPGVKEWDRLWVRVYQPLQYVILIVAGLDAGRFRWAAPVPFGVQLVGLFGFASAYGLLLWAVAANPFYSSAVRVQHDRGQYVITDGPYRWIRHPGYLGNSGLWLCTALGLGSWWALLPAAAMATLFIVRTALEDRVLREELPGYAAYARRVRYRLLPGLW